MKSTFKIKSAKPNRSDNLSFQVNNLSAESQKTASIVQIRKLDKRYIQANPKMSRCAFDCCSNTPTHWLTRQNAEYCQSDLICDRHAKIWMQVRDLISEVRQ